MICVSVRAIALLRDASRSPVEVIQQKPPHPSHSDFVVLRMDRKG